MLEGSDEFPLLDEGLRITTEFGATVDEFPELVNVVWRECLLLRELLPNMAVENNTPPVNSCFKWVLCLNSVEIWRSFIRLPVDAQILNFDDLPPDIAVFDLGIGS